MLILSFPLISFSQWTQKGSDISGLEEGEYCGYAVSLNANGQVAAVGSPYYSIPEDYTGLARIFEYSGSEWTQRGSNITGLETYSWGGMALSLSDDGNVVAVPSRSANNSLGLPSGYVRIFEWDGSDWSQKGEIIEGEGNPLFFLDYFGYDVSLSSDGNVIAIGGPYRWGTDSLGNSMVKSGHARVYAWSGTEWQQRGVDLEGSEASQNLGFSVSLSSDGATLAVGSPQKSETEYAAGQVEVFMWDGNNWVSKGASINGILEGEKSGTSVSLSGDGNTLAIGSPGYIPFHENDHSEVRIFDWDGNNWIQRGSDIIGPYEGDETGKSVSMSQDGNTVVIGAPSSDDHINLIMNAGVIYIYRWDGSNWIQIGEDIYGEESLEFCGNTAAISKDASTIIAGSFGYGENGRARIYSDESWVSINRPDDILFDLYPNPCSEYIVVVSPELSGTMEIVNIRGQKVFSGEILAGYNRFDIQTLTPGVYIANINSEHGNKSIELIRQ